MADNLAYKGRLKKKVNDVIYTFHPETEAEQVLLSDGTTLEARLSSMASDTTVLDAAKAYTDQKLTDLIGDAPAILDTLEELSKALGDDKDFATTMTNALATKADDDKVVKLTGSTMTGDLKINRNSYSTIDNTTLVNKAEVASAIVAGSGRFLMGTTEPTDLRETDVWFEVVE